MHRAAESSWTLLRRAAAGTVAASFTGAWYYRPVADNNNVGNEGPNRADEFFCSSTDPYYIREHTPLLLSTARGLSIGITTIAIRIFMNTYGTFHVVDDVNYQSFLSAVLSRQNGQGLVTVSNHRSLFDDPGVVSGILPWYVTLRPKYNRWGICSQEYCFNNALPGIIKGYIGAGQVLPICRGAGLNQKLLYDFARHLAAGEWLHIFPEGGVWQLNELGGLKVQPGSGGRGRSANGSGKLRWGVAKLIAHAPVRPRVIPFAHAGMENLLPQDPDTGTTSLKKNFLFGSAEPLRVLVRFGEELMFDDLIEEHEKQYGKLWTCSTEDWPDEGGKGFHQRWDSSEAERALYHKITERIEEHLERLSRNVVAEHHALKRR